MYGAFIGDIVGSKYEFNNIKTKDFPLFSRDCDYTDDTIMTVAVAKTILLSHQEQCQNGEKGKDFREILIETMQDFGRRYPHPKGAYGGSFAQWLGSRNPQPYGSYGNGSAMRVSPCGLAAVTLEEARSLARVSACVTHDHPEGLKGAEAVAAAVFLAKCGKSKTEIRQYISQRYYDLDFTLDAIRETYCFDPSCQGTVPQAIVAFLESESFEDAIRSAVSIGGDSDTIGAITGSIAWTYYALQTGGYSGWVYDKLDPSVLAIKRQAMSCLPKEFIEIADAFHEMCWKRAGTFERTGGCTPIWSPRTSLSADSVTMGDNPRYTLDYIRSRESSPEKREAGACVVRYDASMHKWRLQFQLDQERLWFLSVFIREDGRFEKYFLDKEAAADSHYEFREEQKIRRELYASGDERRYFHEILMRYVKENGGFALLALIKPYVTGQFHYD